MTTPPKNVIAANRWMMVMIVWILVFGVHTVSAVGAGPRWTPRSLPPPPPSSRWGVNPHVTPSSNKSAVRPMLDSYDKMPLAVSRGGQDASPFAKTVGTIVNAVLLVCKVVLPPIVEVSRVVIAFYRALPMDAVIAQAGLVYCFAGGYYPTLFAALSAAQNCGWANMLAALDELTSQTVMAIDAAARKSHKGMSYQEIITQKTKIVLATVDPVRVSGVLMECLLSPVIRKL